MLGISSACWKSSLTSCKQVLRECNILLSGSECQQQGPGLPGHHVRLRASSHSWAHYQFIIHQTGKEKKRCFELAETALLPNFLASLLLVHVPGVSDWQSGPNSALQMFNLCLTLFKTQEITHTF